MKILHVGNIANNSYNNAKFLRRIGVEADVLIYNYTNIMGQPEWEDSDFKGTVSDWDPDWKSVDLNGYSRPTWVKEINSVRRFEDQPKVLSPIKAIQNFSRIKNFWLESRKDLSNSEINIDWRDFIRMSRWYEFSRQLKTLFARYDIIQACGIDPIEPFLVSPEIPLISLEHGTLRDIYNGGAFHLLASAYHKSSKVIITNPDVLSYAKSLKLHNYIFVPHPIDDEKFRPKDKLKYDLRLKYPNKIIIFAPARHNWAVKGNDKIIKAFHQLIKEKDAVLIFSDWGQEQDRSKRLIKSLGLGSRVFWEQPIPKMKLVDYYNSSDIVLDQFNIGVFGTTTPEALACGTPVILHYDKKLTDWCFDEEPPVVKANSPKEIYKQMLLLSTNKSEWKNISKRSREWVVKFHGWRTVAGKQLKIYEEILKK